MTTASATSSGSMNPVWRSRFMRNHRSLASIARPLSISRVAKSVPIVSPQRRLSTRMPEPSSSKRSVAHGVLDTRAGGRVREVQRPWRRRRERRHEEDVAAFAVPPHRLDPAPGHEQRSGQLRRDLECDLGGGEVVERPVPRGRGVVDHRGDDAELRLDVGEEPLDRIGVGDVELVGEAHTAGLLDQCRGLRQLVDPPAADGDVPTQSSELRRDRLSDAGARTGDGDDPAACPLPARRSSCCSLVLRGSRLRTELGFDFDKVAVGVGGCPHGRSV